MSDAPVPDGVLEILKNGIRVFSAPDFTVEVLRSLVQQLEDLRAGRVTAMEVENALARSHSDVALEFREWSNWGMNFIQLMLAVAIAVMTWKAQPNSNRAVDDVALDAVESFYRSTQPDLRSLKPPPTERSRGGNRLDARPSADNTQVRKPNRRQRRAAKAKKRKRR